MKRTSKIFGPFSLVAILATSTATAAAVNSEGIDSNTEAAVAPPPAVEEYDYPGADQIYAERGIRLIKGDGKILLVNCTSETPVIKVESISVGTSCYEVIGATGWITMEIPRVYLIAGDDHNVAAQITTNGKTESVDIPPGEHTTVGEGQAPPDDDPATLVELHAS